MPVRLGHWHIQTSNICYEMTGQWSDRSAMSSCKTLSPPDPMSYLRDLALRIWWHWGSHSEREKAPLVWTCRMLQWCSQDSLWHTGWWKAWAWKAKDDMEAADREGLQRVEALGYQPSWSTPGYLVWDLPCVQLTSYLEEVIDVDVAPVPAC